jgi:arsenite methyltransferase
MSTDAAFWNKLAEKYSRQPVGDPEAFDRKIAITQSKMSAQDTVLDIGCGTGSLALRLASSGGHIHGLDLSSEMVRIASGKAADEKRENVSFHVGPFDESFRVFEDGSLDGICAYSLLHLVEDRRAALDQIYRLLKPGAFFVSSTVCLKESWVPFGAIISVMRLFGKAPMVKTITKQTLKGEILQAGFVELSEPDVGAKPIVGFMVAQKPAPTSSPALA